MSCSRDNAKLRVEMANGLSISVDRIADTLVPPLMVKAVQIAGHGFTCGGVDIETERTSDAVLSRAICSRILQDPFYEMSV